MFPVRTFTQNGKPVENRENRKIARSADWQATWKIPVFCAAICPCQRIVHRSVFWQHESLRAFGSFFRTRMCSSIVRILSPLTLCVGLAPDVFNLPKAPRTGRLCMCGNPVWPVPLEVTLYAEKCDRSCSLPTSHKNNQYELQHSRPDARSIIKIRTTGQAYLTFCTASEASSFPRQNAKKVKPREFASPGSYCDLL